MSVSLRDVAGSANGPVAVGETGAVVARAPDGTWGVVVEDGPGATGETLRAVATTDDGERVWFAGANGALGFYDLPDSARRDRSEPDGITDAFGVLTVAGTRGDEKLLLADGNGAVYAAEVAGESLDWGPAYRPAGDTALTDLAATPDGVGYAVDSNAVVRRTTPDEGWRAVGVEDAENSFYAVAAGPGVLLVGGGNGRVYRSTDGGGTWTPFSLGSFTVRALDATGDRAVAAGTNGTLVTRVDDWRPDEWEGSKTINAVALGGVDVAVGNGGLVLERSPEGDGSEK